MTVDHRCRLHVDEVALDADQALDEMVPALLADHGPLAARGVRFKKLPALGLRVGDRAVTLMGRGTRCRSSTVSIGPGSSPSWRPTPSPISSRIDSRRWAWR